jgi:uncharacterized membrane protein YkoI
MKSRSNAWILAAVVSLGPLALSAAPQKESKGAETKEVRSARTKADKAAMEKEAKISMEQAGKIALSRVKGGKIESGELEREHGKLIYSFDIKSPKGITEVNVNAIDGKVVAIQHENAAKEAAEKKQESREKGAAKH